MKAHIKNWLKFFGYPTDRTTWLQSEISEFRGCQWHHIILKGMGCGKARRKRLDQVENIILLSITEHELAHDGTLTRQYLIDKHFENMERTGKDFNENYFNENKS